PDCTEMPRREGFRIGSQMRKSARRLTIGGTLPQLALDERTKAPRPFFQTAFASKPACSSTARIFCCFSGEGEATGDRLGPIDLPRIERAAFTPPGAVPSPSANRSG